MSHLSAGSLRWMLDDARSLEPAERAHLRECGPCRQLAAGVISDARRVAVLLESVQGPAVDAAQVLDSLRRRGMI